MKPTFIIILKIEIQGILYRFEECSHRAAGDIVERTYGYIFNLKETKENILI